MSPRRIKGLHHRSQEKLRVSKVLSKRNLPLVAAKTNANKMFFRYVLDLKTCNGKI
jgi:hypothetical protein